MCRTQVLHQVEVQAQAEPTLVAVVDAEDQKVDTKEAVVEVFCAMSFRTARQLATLDSPRPRRARPRGRSALVWSGGDWGVEEEQEDGGLAGGRVRAMTRSSGLRRRDVALGQCAQCRCAMAALRVADPDAE